MIKDGLINGIIGLSPMEPRRANGKVGHIPRIRPRSKEAPIMIRT